MSSVLLPSIAQPQPDSNAGDKLDSKARIAQLTAQIQARMANKPDLSSITSQK